MADRLTRDYLEILMRAGNLLISQLDPDASWQKLSINDDGIMRALAIRLQNRAAEESSDARISQQHVVAAADVAGGHMLTWREARRVELDREASETGINEARGEMSGTAVSTDFIVATASTAKSLAKASAKRIRRARKTKKAAKKKSSRVPAKRVRRKK